MRLHTSESWMFCIFECLEHSFPGLSKSAPPRPNLQHTPPEVVPMQSEFLEVPESRGEHNTTSQAPSNAPTCPTTPPPVEPHATSSPPPSPPVQFATVPNRPAGYTDPPAPPIVA